MPFKSEKQRRYLWANEPEIARDWTDTYGSRIEKNDGGIMRVGLRNGAQFDTSKGGGAISPGTGVHGGLRHSGRSPGDHHPSGPTHTPKAPTHRPGPSEGWTEEEVREAIKKGETTKELHDLARRKAEEKREEKVEVFRAKNFNDPFNKFVRNLPYISTLDKIFGPFNHREFFLDEVLKSGHYMTDEEVEKFYNMSPTEQEKILKKYNRDRGMGKIDAYGRDIDYSNRGEGQVREWQRLGYPSYEAWLAAQNQGGVSGGITTPVIPTQTISPFQQSLNTGIVPALSSPYYVGANPTAANLAWGQQFNVDPRTMYRTTFANGGPIRQRYFLGNIVKKIGRAAKKVIKSPVGKAALLGFGMFGIPGGSGWTGGLLKSNLMSSGIGEAIKNKLFMKKLKDGTYSGLDPWKLGIMGASTLPFFMGGKEEEEGEVPFDYEAAKNAYMNEIMRIRRNALAGSLDPNQFVYQGIKDGGRIGYDNGGMEDPLLVDEYKKYVFEMEEMGLQPMSFDEFKRQAIAGMASGGRAGYYAGGQSIPSEYTMEDARKTAMQDKLGGITDVMKRADLYRQGDVGQMYMADGGSTQETGIMDLGGVEKDYRETGGFVPIGKEERADDVPARLSLNEFVMTADAVRGMGDGDIDKGAERMEDLMETLEVKGKKNQGASDMFEVSERLSAVV